jgi:hypothetical protein
VRCQGVQDDAGRLQVARAIHRRRLPLQRPLRSAEPPEDRQALGREGDAQSAPHEVGTWKSRVDSYEIFYKLQLNFINWQDILLCLCGTKIHHL